MCCQEITEPWATASRNTCRLAAWEASSQGRAGTGMARTSANPARKDPLRALGCLAQTLGKPPVSTARHGARTFWVGFSPGPGKTCCRNKRQQEEPPVGLEAGSQLKSQGKWLGVGGTFLWDFTYLCWANPHKPIREDNPPTPPFAC